MPVAQIASVVADGELLHLTTARNERHTITYRLKDLERAARSRRGSSGWGGARSPTSTMISRVSPMPGGTYRVTLANGQELQVSRIQSRALRERFLRL